MSNDHGVAAAIIRLMQGVVYRESDEDTWITLERLGGGVRDHFTTIGIDVVIDDAEGYAYLRSRPTEDGDEALPRLVRRAVLPFSPPGARHGPPRATLFAACRRLWGRKAVKTRLD